MATGQENKAHTPPYRLAGVLTILAFLIVTGLVYGQFRGAFIPKTQLTMLAGRAGLVMDPGGPVLFNGVQVGRVSAIDSITRDDQPAAKFTLDVDPKYIKLIPANVDARIEASTLFGNKAVSLSAPKNPSTARVSPKTPIDAISVTVENNTLFQTITNLSESVDPVKLNLTLHAAAQALDGLGQQFGESLVKGNEILDHANARMPQFRHEVQQWANLSEIYANGAPDLVGFLDHASVTVATITEQQKQLNAILLAATGIGNLGADVTNRAGPYIDRQFHDLIPVTGLMDTYSPELFCSIRNLAEAAKEYPRVFGGDGYSLRTNSQIVSPANPYLYPENLPRYNAHGGPGGAPGCWQPITRDFWPAPYLVADTGVSQAPYNHFEIGSPWAIEYVWGRQVGDFTINP
ncbi:MCE family protein [Mycobacterium sp. M1]|uniref:MCE family protein n=1 Tax=Mycolicibacter acidiphilus TaxID=2835306 RepID=A0ABS5RNV2_9MYCO|nr:MCE family protein [Mycolicibacter acidiphilus]MBS9535707.1 MCE family protein [Mycolicibacter acidiphilus]